MRLRRMSLVVAVLCTSALAPPALASGGDYVFDGGTANEQSQVEQALDVSSFPWSVVPGPVVVHIQRGVASEAAPGQIWLDANLLDAGPFAWGVVQHEYGHQVDYALLTDGMRAQLHTLLQGASWWSSGGEGHSQFDCERFADLVSWAYWPSQDNVMRPQSAHDEGGQMTPAAFRAELAALLPSLSQQAVRQTAAAQPAPAGHRGKH
jgi:hypothetical protein